MKCGISAHKMCCREKVNLHHFNAANIDLQQGVLPAGGYRCVLLDWETSGDVDDDEKNQRRQLLLSVGERVIVHTLEF